jgi:hypothetical protein
VNTFAPVFEPSASWKILFDLKYNVAEATVTLPTGETKEFVFVVHRMELVAA